MADERDIGAGIAALAMVHQLTIMLRNRGILSQLDAEMSVQAALVALEKLQPPDSAAVRFARELAEIALQDLSL